MDEVRHTVKYANLDLVFHDNVVAVESSSAGTEQKQHGGVCVYIRNTIKFTVLDDL